MIRAVILILIWLLPAETQAAAGASPPSPLAASSAGQKGALLNAAVPDTLMFTIDELNEIQSRAAAIGRKKEDDSSNNGAIESATLYLSTIVYYGPQDWTVWVNGIPIRPGQEFQAFQITDIQPDHVELMVPLSAQGMRPVRLSPNQTFIAKTGTVVEGPWR
jgi:hypothetical protein